MANYTAPPLTVDGVVLQCIDDVLQVLLIERQRAPFKGMWALPGGYVDGHETTGAALQRVLHTKAGLEVADLTYVEQLYTFDTPAAQDPRGHAVSVVYYALGRSFEAKPSDSTESPTFVPVRDLPELAYQHKDIVLQALERLRGKALYTNILWALLPPEFTLTQAQLVYEEVLGRRLDKRNFRKKFLQLGLVDATDNYQADGAHRPARMYRFRQQHLQTLSRNFD